MSVWRRLPGNAVPPGVVRFLRDAGLLDRVRHIFSISGGSILGADLALHWREYVNSGETFRAQASRLVKFARYDLRGRIVWQLHRSPTARLEKYYRDGLFGQKRLRELGGRGRPTLWLLATNLTTEAQRLHGRGTAARCVRSGRTARAEIRRASR